MNLKTCAKGTKLRVYNEWNALAFFTLILNVRIKFADSLLTVVALLI